MKKAFIHHNKRLKGREIGNISQYFRKKANGKESWSQWEKVITKLGDIQTTNIFLCPSLSGSCLSKAQSVSNVKPNFVSWCCSRHYQMLSSHSSCPLCSFHSVSCIPKVMCRRRWCRNVNGLHNAVIKQFSGNKWRGSRHSLNPWRVDAISFLLRESKMGDSKTPWISPL